MRVLESPVAAEDVCDFGILIRIFGAYLLQKVLVLFNSVTLFLNPLCLLTQDRKLFLFAFYFFLFVFILIFEFSNVFIAFLHLLLVHVEVRGEVDDRLLNFLIFISQLFFLLTELELLLLEFLLLHLVLLLVLIHHAALLQQSGCW